MYLSLDGHVYLGLCGQAHTKHTHIHMLAWF